MRKLLLLLFFGMLLISCNSAVIEKPNDLIGKDKMVAILYDLNVINAIKNADMVYLSDRKITPANYILHKYKVDSLQFSRSDRYYASDVAQYEKIYERVIEKLRVNKVALDSLIAKNPIKNEKDAAEKAVEKAALDSLKKKFKSAIAC